MSALTVERVLAWKPETLSTAASSLDPVAQTLDAAERTVSTAGDALATRWTGTTASAAQQRITSDTRDARELAAAV
ncbi:hypothetical protein G9H71_19235, partial [Motilibacter sp. E257]